MGLYWQAKTETLGGRTCPNATCPPKTARVLGWNPCLCSEGAVHEPVRRVDGTCCCPYVCMWCKELLCATHRVVTLSGANSRGAAGGENAWNVCCISATNWDVSETTLALEEVNGGSWRWVEVNGGKWRWMMVNGGKWKCMEVDGGEWRWIEVSGLEWR